MSESEFVQVKEPSTRPSDSIQARKAIELSHIEEAKVILQEENIINQQNMIDAANQNQLMEKIQHQNRLNDENEAALQQADQQDRDFVEF